MKANQPYEFVLTGFHNTDNVSHQNFFICPHLSTHAGQNDMFLLQLTVEYNAAALWFSPWIDVDGPTLLLLWIYMLQVLISEYQI